jgi:aspartate racemase
LPYSTRNFYLPHPLSAEDILNKISKKVIGIPALFCSEYFIKTLQAKISDKTDISLLIGKNTSFIDSKPHNPALSLSSKKIAAYIDCSALIGEGATVIACPNISAQTWRTELQTELSVPVADMASALTGAGRNLKGKTVFFPGKAGTPKADFLTKALDKDQQLRWVLATDEESEAAVSFEKASADTVKNAEECRKIISGIAALAGSKGASAVVPSCIRMCQFEDIFKSHGLELINIIDLYADALVNEEFAAEPKPFKLGLVGGLGPAATVDLYDKIVKATPAANDQEHIKVIIDQNPQIADRTKFLLDGGKDPTLALFAVCRNLERNGADAILIPCNTAHAYIEDIERYLNTPIINMQQVCLEFIRDTYGKNCVIGLMATDGTCKTRIYADKAEELGLKLVVPDADFQKYVMSAIYGPQGVKAGITDGLCKEELLTAARHLVRDKNANVLILGCTELPLILKEGTDCDIGEGLTAHIVDPTATIARKAVEVAMKGTVRK